MHRLGSHLVRLPDVSHRDEHRRVMPVDLNARFDCSLSFWRSHCKSSVAHLAALVSICVTRFLGLTFDCHSILERLQYATGPTHDLHVFFNAAADLDIGFTGNSGGHFDEPDLVTFDQVNAFLRFRFVTTGGCSRNTTSNR